jgi:hypothetical protein
VKRTEDEEAFDAFVRARGVYFLRVSVLLTGSVSRARTCCRAAWYGCTGRGSGSTSESIFSLPLLSVMPA